MVHAKAQHMLAQVYRGRLNDDDAGNGGYPMSDMHAGQPGQKAPGGVADMFEVVKEADLDFQNFKNILRNFDKQILLFFLASPSSISG